MTGGGCSDGTLIGKWQHPPSFYCPISQQCLHDPVVLCDGHTYERRHIERWLLQHNTSPVSGLKLPQKDIFPNHALRNAIEEYFQQVFSAHRRAIRKTMARPAGEDACSSACLARRVDALMQCALLMSADLSTECVMRQIMDEAKTLLGAEVASVFLYDAARQELFSTVNSTGGELRIPVECGIAGHVARTGEPQIIRDAYEDGRFDCTVDAKTGFRTRSMLCVPLKAKKGRTLGVAQLLNKTAADTWTEEDGGEPKCFTPEDLHLLQVFASQAATALANDGAFETVWAAAPAEAAEAATTPDSAAAVPAYATELVRSLTDELAQASCALGLSRNLPEELEDTSDAAEFRGASSQPASVSPSSEGSSSDHVTTLKVSLGAATEAVAEPKSRPEEEAAVADLLQQAFDGWDFDALGLARLTGNRPLSSLAASLFKKAGLVEDLGLDEEKVVRFFEAIENGYDDGSSVAYHNRAHAASVLHVMHALLQHGGVLAAAAPALATGQGGGGDAAGAASGGQLERMACLLAAAVHDYDHLGLSNDFLARTGDERALRYNDTHVNEQHHAAAAFSVLLRPENNFLAHLPVSDFRRLRSLVVDLVIGTDMAEGGRILQSFLGKLDASSVGHGDLGEASFSPSTVEDARLFLQMAMKCADLGHLSLDWEKHCQWVQLLETEFFAQGDLERERGLPISFLMDRSKPGASATQVGFFEFVALPLFRALVRAAPAAEPVYAGTAANYGRWKEQSTAGKSDA